MNRKSGTVEIRWHGRGGQGAKTACLLLADACFGSGKQVQGFPEYGPERMGAPITAYNRISDGKNRVHSNIYRPDYVVVVDETLIGSVDVTKGLSEEGTLLVNTRRTPDEIRKKLPGFKGEICTVDADRISRETLGKSYPNTPMLAATVKVSRVVDPKKFMKDMEASFRHKFASKPYVIDGNMKALSMSMEQVRVG
ncbi:MAG: 2-oxoacid:acceptor oxidoreductase family protein [Anaerovoracaceae bacterium]|jgi:pyruvate ferredoxin oxidoreductase gamma subunit